MRRRRGDLMGAGGTGPRTNGTVLLRFAAEPLVGARRAVPLRV